MVTKLIVVLRDHPELFLALQREFASCPSIRIILDRRHRDRRHHNIPVDDDRRRHDRRSLSKHDADVRTRHYLLARPHPCRSK